MVGSIHRLDYAPVGGLKDRLRSSRGFRTGCALALFLASAVFTPIAYFCSIFILFISWQVLLILMPLFTLAAFIGSSYEPAMRRAGVGELSPSIHVMLAVMVFTQIPLYGLILAIALYKMRFRRGLIIVACLHVAAIVSALVCMHLLQPYIDSH